MEKLLFLVDIHNDTNCANSICFSYDLCSICHYQKFWSLCNIEKGNFEAKSPYVHSNSILHHQEYRYIVFMLWLTTLIKLVQNLKKSPFRWKSLSKILTKIHIEIISRHFEYLTPLKVGTSGNWINIFEKLLPTGMPKQMRKFALPTCLFCAHFYSVEKSWACILVQRTENSFQKGQK